MSLAPVRRYRAPRGALSEFVELLWLFDGYVQPHAEERLLPMATTELVIDLRSAAAASDAATVAGPASEHWVLETSAAASVIGVHFRAGGAFPFFDFPASELHNVRVPLEALWGPPARVLVEQVLAAPTPEAKFDVLERVLLATARTLSHHRAVTFALRELSVLPPRCGVADVTEQIGMSQRRFRECFRSEVGMAPKLFARVQRFQAVIETVHTLTEVSWADVAIDCGYFDQAHFIHDFRAFSGFTPSAYLALKSEHRNHVPLPA
ncbi:MAG TPA: helix-turn-helix transcriptional regulator [Steroidobacteraceae bacterium]|nr:helix-turn-helix transcriptional regulator [Steroidobacteraceae bacterium]